MATTAPAQAAPAATPNRPARLNRILLTVLGLLLLLAGAYTLLRGLGVLGQDALGPLGLPGQDAQGALLPPGLAGPSWLPWATIAAAVLVGLLCLRWLLAQTGRRASSAATWQFTGARDQGSTRMDATAAADAIAADVSAYAGVHTARAVITGDRTAPQLHLTLTVGDHAPVTEIRERIDTEALPRLRHALEIDTLPTEILLRLGASPTPSRVG